MSGAIADALAGWLPVALANGLGRWLDAWLTLLDRAAKPLAAALAVVLVCTAFELWRPAEPGQGLRGRLRNLVHLFVFQTLGSAALALWVVHGPALAPSRHAPGPLLAILLVAANLAALDFAYYWYHRAQHRFPALWAIHELHHSDTALNATTSFRTYWLEMLVQAIVVLTPSLLLFGDQGPVHGFGMLIGTYAFLVFSHCNVRLSLGPLSLFVCGPQVHRIHHSRLPEHRDRNFAQYFPLLDRIFGTWHAPGRDEFPPTGADGLASDAPFGTALARPFRIWAGRG